MKSLVEKKCVPCQDPCKNAITCKILQGNFFLARSCKVIFSLQDFSEILLICMIFQKITEPWKCKEQKTKILNCQSFKLLFSCVSLSRNNWKTEKDKIKPGKGVIYGNIVSSRGTFLFLIRIPLPIWKYQRWKRSKIVIYFDERIHFDD